MSGLATRIMLKRWWQQDQLCIWCGQWCWARQVILKDDARRRLGLEFGRHSHGKLLRARTATAEHVLPVSLGGKTETMNIVCACHVCNTTRGSAVAMRKPHAETLARLPDDVQQHVLRAIDNARIPH